MTDLAIDRDGPEEVPASEWEWPQSLAAPRTLTEARLSPPPLSRVRPDASASWAVDDEFSFDVVRVDQPVIRVYAATARRRWFMPLIDSLTCLFSLPPDWNGYGESAVDIVNASRVISVLEKTDFDGPEPSVVPLHDGGVQIEWHWGDRHLEIQFPVGRAPSAWWCDAEVDEDWDIATAADGRRLHRRLSELTATP